MDKVTPRREIEFKPGLNVISSTPPGCEEASGNSYNVGKTALCGLIRYCLGASHFGSEKLERQIRKAFRNGAVSAEVIVDGEPWSIIRGFGLRRPASAQQGLAVTDLWRDYESQERSGIAAYIDAIESALGLDVQRFREMEPQELPFQTAIGLMTRDHVVGFRDVLQWSNSRAREAKFTRENREKLILALLGVCTESLPSFKATAPPPAVAAAQAQAKHLAEALRAKLRLPKSIRGNQAAAMKVIEKRVEEADTARKGAMATQQAVQIRLKVAELQKQLDEAEKALLDECTVCPVTKENISTLIDQGCLLKDAGCEPEAAHARVDQIRKSLKEARSELKKIKRTQSEIPESEADLDERLKQARLESDRWERLVKERTKTWNDRRADKTTLETVNSLNSEAQSHQQQPKGISTKPTEDAPKAEVQASHKPDLASAFSRVVAHFISDDAVGELDGLLPRINVPAEGSGPGNLESIAGDRGALLGVLSFDFSVVVLSMEKEACVPPLLVHDSPRLQDLDKTSYSRLFWLARALELACGDQPLFQYIVTTSTPPPPDCGEWCRLRLDGGKPDGEGRLFLKVF